MPTCWLFMAFCLQTDQQGNFRRYRVSDIPFVYRIHNSAPSEWVEAIDAGAQVWNDIPASFWKFENGGFTSTQNVARDNVNLVFFDRQGVNFGPPGSNAIAFSSTFTSGSEASFRAVESDYIFNARDFPPALNGEFGQQDLQGVSAHEFGHHMGIMHTGPSGNGGQRGCGPSFPSATMFAFSAPGDTTSRSLHFDDKAAAAFLYPNWMIRGTVTKAATGEPLPQAALVSDEIFAASLIGPVEFSGAWYQVPGAATAVAIDESGDYLAVSLLQDYTMRAELYGYRSQSTQISFNPPGGIGQTQTITRNFSLTASSQVQLTGSVVDARNGNPVPAEITIAAVSEKPGVPQEPIAVLSTDNSGGFSVTVPAEEDFRIDILPLESPFAPLSQIVTNVSPSGQQVSLPLLPADVMLVDDDGGQEYERFFQNAFANISRSYFTWNVEASGAPQLSDIEKFPNRIIVWFTGDGNGVTLTAAEQDVLLDHINNNGELFLTGQNIAEQLSGSELLNRMGISFAKNISIPIILGIDNDITDGMVFPSAGSGGANNQNSRDQLSIEDPAIARTIFKYGTNSALTAAAAIELNSARTVFFGFGWEAIGNNAAREATLDVILDYLEDAVTAVETTNETPGVPVSFQLQQNYPNPFNPSTTIEFSLQNAGEVSLEVYNTAGQKIATLVNNRMGTGEHNIIFKADDFASGIYFYTLKSGQYQRTRKMILLR